MNESIETIDESAISFSFKLLGLTILFTSQYINYGSHRHSHPQSLTASMKSHLSITCVTLTMSFDLYDYSDGSISRTSPYIVYSNDYKRYLRVTLKYLLLLSSEHIITTQNPDITSLFSLFLLQYLVYPSISLRYIRLSNTPFTSFVPVLYLHSHIHNCGIHSCLATSTPSTPTRPPPLLSPPTPTLIPPLKTTATIIPESNPTSFPKACLPIPASSATIKPSWTTAPTLRSHNLSLRQTASGAIAQRPSPTSRQVHQLQNTQPHT